MASRRTNTDSDNSINDNGDYGGTDYNGRPGGSDATDNNRGYGGFGDTNNNLLSQYYRGGFGNGYSRNAVTRVAWSSGRNYMIRTGSNLAWEYNQYEPQFGRSLNNNRNFNASAHDVFAANNRSHGWTVNYSGYNSQASQAAYDHTPNYTAYRQSEFGYMHTQNALSRFTPYHRSDRVVYTNYYYNRAGVLPNGIYRRILRPIGTREFFFAPNLYANFANIQNAFNNGRYYLNSGFSYNYGIGSFNFRRRFRQRGFIALTQTPIVSSAVNTFGNDSQDVQMQEASVVWADMSNNASYSDQGYNDDSAVEVNASLATPISTVNADDENVDEVLSNHEESDSIESGSLHYPSEGSAASILVLSGSPSVEDVNGTLSIASTESVSDASELDSDLILYDRYLSPDQINPSAYVTTSFTAWEQSDSMVTNLLTNLRASQANQQAFDNEMLLTAQSSSSNAFDTETDEISEGPTVSNTSSNQLSRQVPNVIHLPNSPDRNAASSDFDENSHLPYPTENFHGSEFEAHMHNVLHEEFLEKFALESDNVAIQGLKNQRWEKFERDNSKVFNDIWQHFFTGFLVINYRTLSSHERDRVMPSKVATADENIVNCVICFDFILPDQLCTRLRCSHDFHSDCLRTWWRKHINCPVCRAKYDNWIFQHWRKEFYQKSLSYLPSLAQVFNDLADACVSGNFGTDDTADKEDDDKEDAEAMPEEPK